MVLLILTALLCIVGLTLWLIDGRHDNTTQHGNNDTPAQEDEQCCGMHITCEKDSLLASVSDSIVYYEDEELDRFAGRGANDYTDTEIEEFRDILLTLHPDEIAGWGRNIQLRGITLPTEVREELLMIVAEARRSVQ